MPHKTSAQEVKLIPRETLFGNPVKTAPQLSPDGKKIAYIAPVNNVLNVWVKTVGKDDDHPVTKDTDRGIRNYFWAHDLKNLLYLQDKGGNENWRLYAIDLSKNELRDLTPYENVQVRILDVDKRHPNDILIEMNKENTKVHDVYHLDLKTGKLDLTEKNPGNYAGWFVDYQMRVRGASVSRDDGGNDFYFRGENEKEFKLLVSWSMEDSILSGPLYLSPDGKYLYLKDSRVANTAGLVRMNMATQAIETVASDPIYDLSGLTVHPDTFELETIIFYKDKQEVRIVNPAVEKDYAAIRSNHAGEFGVSSRDHTDKTWLVGYSSDSGPSSFYTYDRATRKFTFLFETKPELNKYTLTSLEPISFKSRDGLDIHGYIAFPPGQERKNLPMVLNVHGGPWSRDGWGLDPEAQWLANRGYICLQVNFRGSTGYGKDFVNAGNREWGRKMQDDLTDAVQWAIQQGYADPKRVAIYGGSYGGYAALAGATFTPDLYACAVDIVGPSSLLSFIKTIPPYWSVYLEEFYKRVGHPEKDKEFLEAASPLYHVDKIKIPMLIAQGANDPRVNEAESEQIVKALKEKGIDYEYMLFPDEGHGFAKPQNRLKFYATAEKFLAKHLGGRFEEISAVAANNVHSFTVKTIDGEEKSLSDFKGKALLIVNTASKCGFTPQYKSLENLYEKYKDRGFEVLAFPANNFMGQEPGSDKEIKEFCSLKFHASFPLFSKISVKGKDQSALYRYLTEDTKFKGDIPWNFTKFLVDADGNVIARYAPTTDPLSKSVTSEIEQILPKR